MVRRTLNVKPASVLLMVAGLAAGSTSALAQTRTWLNPVTGNWSVPGNWSGTNVPDNTGENALISALGGYTVFVDGNYSIGGLAIPGTVPGVQVAINNARSLDVLSIDNSGTITISDGGGGSGTNLRALSNVVISGNGAIVLNANGNLDTATLSWFNNTATQSFTNGPEHTVQGSGRVYALFTNNGLVSADRNNQTLELLSTTKTNNSEMQATGGGILRISGVTVNQSGAAVIASNGGRIDFSGATINGGQVQVNSGSGRIVGGSAFNDVTLQGSLNVLNSFNLDLGGGELTNYGEIVVSDLVSGSGTNIRSTGDILLGGSGSILLRANGNLDTATLSWFNNSSTQRFVNGADHTIHGTGNIYSILVNQGYVAADTPGATLQLLSTNKSNTGTLAADLGGTLTINGVSVDQTGGGAIAAFDGVFRAVNAAVVGGIVTSPAPNGSTRITGTSTFSDVDFAGRLNVDNASWLRVGGTALINNGTIAVSDSVGGSGSGLQATGANSLLGSGEVVLNANGNLDTAEITWTNNSSTQTFVNGPAHTIRGTGNIYTILTNQGSVLADRTGATLQLLHNNKINRGLMKASGGGTLRISGIAVTQEGVGQIVADGGALQVAGSSIIDGPINVAPSGSATFTGTSVLSDVTINGNSAIANFHTVRVGGAGITNNGTLRVSDGVGGSGTVLGALASVTLAGNGSVELDALPGNLDSAYLFWTSNSSTQGFTNAASHTIRGSGNVHAFLVNNGLVTADKSGRILQLVTTTKTNNNILRATNNGTLAISGVAVNQAPAARIEAVAGNLSFASCSVSGGAIAVDGASSSTFTGSSTLNDVTHSGRSSVASAASLSVGGSGLTNNGTIRVNDGVSGSGTVVRTNGDMTLSGTGDLELDANPGNLDTAYMYWNSNSSTQVFNNGASHTIHGSGNIYTTVTNFGTISADKPGRTLQLLSNNKVNQGLIRATGGGNLTINGVAVTQQGGGRIEAQSGGISVANGTIIDGPVTAFPGFAVTSSGSSRLSGVTFTGAWNQTNASTLSIAPAGITNNGVIRVSDGVGGSGTPFRSEGAATLSGNGTLLLAANPGNLDTAYLQWTSNSSTQYFINGASHTLGGTGRVYTHFTNHGTISPGAGPGNAGVLDFRQTTTLSATSVCRFEVSGTSAGQYDRVTGVGTMQLNGTLRASFFGGFTPTVNDNFTIISGPTIVGEFARVELPKGWWVEYGSNFARMHYTGCLADWNYSGGVDGDDVIAFFSQWDNSDPEADINLDGGVDGDDVIDFFARWDAGC